MIAYARSGVGRRDNAHIERTRRDRIDAFPARGEQDSETNRIRWNAAVSMGNAGHFVFAADSMQLRRLIESGVPNTPVLPLTVVKRYSVFSRNGFSTWRMS